VFFRDKLLWEDWIGARNVEPPANKPAVNYWQDMKWTAEGGPTSPVLPFEGSIL